MAWRQLSESLIPWVKTVNRIVTSVQPPALSGPTLTIASDYSGTHSRSQYRVNAFVCIDTESSMEWEFRRREVRKQYMADGRRISYKGLADRQQAAALAGFLEAANTIHGFCLVTIIRKSIRHLCVLREPSDYQMLREAKSLSARWKDRELEDALRVAHFVACLVGGLSNPGQNVYWISDQDELFGNPSRAKDMTSLLSMYSSYYIKHGLGEIGVGTTTLDEGDRWEEDMCSVADLIAGAIAETTNRLAEVCGGRLPSNLAVEYPGEFVSKAESIANWFWTSRQPLRRVAVLFENGGEGRYAVSKHEMLE